MTIITVTLGQQAFDKIVTILSDRHSNLLVTISTYKEALEQHGSIMTDQAHDDMLGFIQWAEADAREAEILIELMHTNRIIKEA